MTTIMFDTLAYSNKLQSAGFPREQAEAMTTANVDALKDLVHAQDLATKQDLAIPGRELETSIIRTKNELEKLIITTGSDLEAVIWKCHKSFIRWMVTGFTIQTAVLVAALVFFR